LNLSPPWWLMLWQNQFRSEPVWELTLIFSNSLSFFLISFDFAKKEYRADRILPSRPNTKAHYLFIFSKNETRGFEPHPPVWKPSTLTTRPHVPFGGRPVSGIYCSPVVHITFPTFRRDGQRGNALPWKVVRDKVVQREFLYLHYFKEILRATGWRDPAESVRKSHFLANFQTLV
jgi:hypothetical protein